MDLRLLLSLLPRAMVAVALEAKRPTATAMMETECMIVIERGDFICFGEELK